MKSSTHNDVTLRSKTGRRCRVLFSYQPANEDELRLNVDDVIDVITEVEDGWWKGRLGEMVGVFPSNFVTEILAEEPRRPRPGSRDEARRVLDMMSPGESDNDRSTSVSSPDSAQVVEAPSAAGAAGDTDVPSLPPKPVKEQCRVLFAYEAANGDELTLKEGEIVTVLSRDVQDKGWWRGELNSKVGLFPDNFVELIQAPAPTPDEPPRKPERAVIAKPVSAATNKLRDSITRPPTKTEVPPVPIKKPPVSLPGRAKLDGVDGAGPSRLGRSLDARPLSFKTTESTTSSSRSLDSPAKPVDPKPSDSAPQSLEPTPDSNAFDNIARSAMLTHPTALRVKPPSRRPPSNTSTGKEEGSPTPSLTNGTSTENLHPEETSKKSWEREKNKPPWMEELKRNQIKKKDDPRTSRPVSLYAPKPGSSPPPTKAMSARTTVEVAGNGVSSVMSKSLSFKSESSTRTVITPKVKKTSDSAEGLDVNELAAMVRSLQASLDQHKEETARELHDLAQKLNEERQKRVQVELQLNKLTDLVTQV